MVVASAPSWRAAEQTSLESGCHVETPKFCWEMFCYGYLTSVLPICQLVLNDWQAKKPKGFLRWPPAIGRSGFQFGFSSWGRLSTPQSAPLSEVTLWMWIPSHFKSLMCIMHLFQFFFAAFLPPCTHTWSDSCSFHRQTANGNQRSSHNRIMTCMTLQTFWNIKVDMCYFTFSSQTW